jgi:hypothetical protein
MNKMNLAQIDGQVMYNQILIMKTQEQNNKLK